MAMETGEDSSKYPYVSALCMNGGDGDKSYSANSLIMVLSSSI